MILGSPYAGRKAKIYLAKRTDKAKWHNEQVTVERMLNGVKGNVLDVAIGTGRFIELYFKLDLDIVGIDISADMMQQIPKATKGKIKLYTGDANRLQFKDREFNTVVCVRLLHLVEEKEMQLIVMELCRVAKKHIIITIQMRDKYYVGGDTCTHVTERFCKLVNKLGWSINESEKITSAGWYVLKLERKDNETNTGAQRLSGSNSGRRASRPSRNR